MSLTIKNSIKALKLQVLNRPCQLCFILIVGLNAPLAEADNAGWQVSGLGITAQQSGVRLSADYLGYDGTELFDIDYFCPESLTLYPHHQCQNGTATFTYDKHIYDVTLATQFNAADEDWSVDLATNNKQINIAVKANDNIANIKIEDLQIAQFFTQAEQPFNSILGTFNGQILANMNDLTLVSPNSIQFTGVSFEYSSDIVVAELAGSLVFDLDVNDQKLNIQIEITAGEMLFDQLYIDFSSYPIAMRHQIHINDAKKYEINSKVMNQQSLEINAQVLMDDDLKWVVPELKIEVKDSHHFNQNILNNVLGIYGFANSLMSGGFVVQVNSAETSFDQWQVSFDDFYLLNEKRKLQADALDGKIYWNSNQLSNDSLLHWQNLLLAGMPINESQIRFNFSKDQLKLVGPHEFPVFDGAINLKELTIELMFSAEVGMTLNASVLPISLKLITEKLGWPVMSGTISGDIPGMIKKGSVIDFLGALKLTVFEGSMLVENLSLERLFAVAPVIAADVSFELFDLSLLTETFGFGQITGRLSGEVNDLRITNWKTDRMDAQVYTVKTKKVKQTISQKAIENISSLGGIKGAISKTFLRFFADFSYKKIKLSCKLHNSVCQIGGLKNQNNQFVIVEGGGIPKINIVGFVREINWEEFIDRLLNANYSN